MTGPHDLGDFLDVLSQAIDASGTGIWDRDVVSGEIRYSAGWFTILGYRDVPLSNRIEESYARVHPDDLPAVMEAMQAHFDGKTTIYEVEHRLRCVDGTYKWVLSRGRVIERDPEGRARRMVGTTTDVTATRELAEELKVLHARACDVSVEMATLADALTQRTEALAAAHRLARVGVWRWDLAAKRIWFSPEIWGLMGRVSRTGAIDYDEMRAMYHPDDYERAMETFLDVVRHKAPVTLEYRIIRGDGAVHDVLTHAEPVLDPFGEVAQIHGTSQDITPYRRIEAALRESEDHHRHMVDLNPQIPWTAGPDGEILEVGPKWFAMTGSTWKDPLLSGWESAIHAEDRAATLAIWRQCLVSGQPLDVEYRVRLVQGGYGWLRARAAPRRDDCGRIIRWYGSLEDVTDRHAAEALAFRVLESTSDAVIVCSRQGIVTFANSRAASMVECGPSIAGREVGSLFPGTAGEMLGVAVQQAVATGEAARFELYLSRSDLWFEVKLFAGSGDVSIFLRDVSEQLRAQQKLRHAATHDALTGAVNRAALFTQLSEQLAQQDADNHVVLLCLDLDYFKEVNDAHGHPVGDALLRQVADRLHACLRSRDVLARCGGDEFVMMQTGGRGDRDAVMLAERVLEAMRPAFEVEGLRLAGSLSIGIAISTLGMTDADALYAQADRALYEAKTRARGRFRIFRPEMQAAFDAVRNLRSDMVAGLARQEFSLAFQPIVRVSDGRTIGTEALMRWNHPERGWVPPTDFVPIAEESGQIAALGEWALCEACAVARLLPEDVKMAVNVSPRQFETGDLVDVVRKALRTAEIPASRLELEVTESVLLTQTPANLRTLRELRKLGVTLVLDDFGTGYSSLAYLDMFTFDFLKIDKSFIAHVRHSGDRQPILESILGMARALNLPVTAEGIETRVQLDYVRRIGCAFVQGYLISMPREAAALGPSLAGQWHLA